MGTVLKESFSKHSQKRRSDSGITFVVDDVAPAEKPIWTERLADNLPRRLRRKIYALSEPERHVANYVADEILKLFPQAGSNPLPLPVSRSHSLMDTIHTAFSQHRPLTLSPDCIWLVFAQGFSHHLAENAEALRHRLVRHQGRRELQARVTDLTLASFEQAIQSFSAQIRAATDPVLHETLVCNFSTTTPVTRTASEVVLMDSYSNYFTYRMGCICGIPKITLTGTPDDWQSIRERVEVLETYDLGWWVSRLRPILDEFVAAANGHPTQDFWKSIYKPARAYAALNCTGWIVDLFPYLGDPPRRRRNEALLHQREDWTLPLAGGVCTDQFPSGLTSVPVKMDFPNSLNHECALVAGFFGMEQNPSDLSLSPLIGWSVAEPAPATPIHLH
jgi:hypothetical protein